MKAFVYQNFTGAKDGHEYWNLRVNKNLKSLFKCILMLDFNN